MLKPLVIAFVAAACTSPHDHGEGRPHDSWASTEATEGELVQQALDHARTAAARYDSLRATRVDRMRGKLAMDQLEETMLRGVANLVDLPVAGRDDVDARLDTLTDRLDQASLALDTLDEATDRDYAAAEQTARESLVGRRGGAAAERGARSARRDAAAPGRPPGRRQGRRGSRGAAVDLTL